MITVDESIFNALDAPAEALNIVGLGSLCEEIILYVPGCADLMIRKELQKTFRAFCEITGTLMYSDKGIVTHVAPSLAISRDDGEFQLFLGAKFDAVDCYRSQVELQKECGGVSVLFTINPDEIDADGNPVEHDAEVIYSVVPRIGTEVAPLWFLNKHGSALVAGTLFRLQSMPKKPWSDPVTAQLNAVVYQNALNNAVIDRLTGGNKIDLNCRAPLPWC